MYMISRVPEYSLMLLWMRILTFSIGAEDAAIQAAINPALKKLVEIGFSAGYLFRFQKKDEML